MQRGDLTVETGGTDDGFGGDDPGVGEKLCFEFGVETESCISQPLRATAVAWQGEDGARLGEVFARHAKERRLQGMPTFALIGVREVMDAHVAFAGNERSAAVGAETAAGLAALDLGDVAPAPGPVECEGYASSARLKGGRTNSRPRCWEGGGFGTICKALAGRPRGRS